MFSTYELLVLALILGAFSTFAVTLFLLSVGSPRVTDPDKHGYRTSPGGMSAAPRHAAE